MNALSRWARSAGVIPGAAGLTLDGRLSGCTLLTFRTPAERAQSLLPPGLELVRRGPWAFWNVMACRVEHLRPEGLPTWCGLTYHHVTYRLLAQAMTRDTEVHRGITFIRSDADAVTRLGAWLSDSAPHCAEIEQRDSAGGGLAWRITGTAAGRGDGELIVRPGATLRPADSCFATALDADAFCQAPPVALAAGGGAGDGPAGVRLTEVERDPAAWRTRPVVVERCELGVLTAAGVTPGDLEHAVVADPIDCRWRLGRTEPVLRAGPGLSQRCPARRRDAVGV